tara:strand:- start:196 stop:396 length:201 start_codon:yes stop_codon:yes gene_type:complete
MLKHLSRREIELAMRVVQESVGPVFKIPLTPLALPKSLQALSEGDWIEIWVVLGALQKERNQSVIH